MAKTLVAVRHAKSSWDDLSLDDIDRPLNKRGRRAAPAMAEHLAQKAYKPDLLLSSPALRARQTAQYFEAEFEMEEVKIDDRLYFQGSSGLMEAFQDLPSKADSVFFFCHEPMISDFCHRACGWLEYKYPTAAVCVMQIEISSWDQLAVALPGQMLYYTYPKMISSEL